MNRVSLIGNVTRELELCKSKEGEVPYTRFTLAVNEYVTSTKERKTTFVDIVAFGRKAEILSRNVQKGQKLAVEGKISTGSYFNNDGIKVYTTSIIMENFTFISSKKDII
ncbi:single-stranded DNA-binding protein [Clostridium bornimense]|uniref:single-stranded DNA-binding protein n=2 Tax=Clostridium TaxID=1485 RepID=UPI001C1144AB|nr:single-stranded DNA-binding protein [Clostridium bornimense]MBU5317717.1 single-stranded DNA-binding protein [Clostridium bornimense]